MFTFKLVFSVCQGDPAEISVNASTLEEAREKLLAVDPKDLCQCRECHQRVMYTEGDVVEEKEETIDFFDGPYSDRCCFLTGELSSMFTSNTKKEGYAFWSSTGKYYKHVIFNTFPDLIKNGVFAKNKICDIKVARSIDG